jgi:hypothetical protein
VGHLFTFYCYLFAKWKSFLGSTNLQNGKAFRPFKGLFSRELMYTISQLVTRRGHPRSGSNKTSLKISKMTALQSGGPYLVHATYPLHVKINFETN